MGTITMNDIVGVVMAFIFGGISIVFSGKILPEKPASIFETLGLVLVLISFIWFMSKFFKTDKIKDALGKQQNDREVKE